MWLVQTPVALDLSESLEIPRDPQTSKQLLADPLQKTLANRLCQSQTSLKDGLGPEGGRIPYNNNAFYFAVTVDLSLFSSSNSPSPVK